MNEEAKEWHGIRVHLASGTAIDTHLELPTDVDDEDLEEGLAQELADATREKRWFVLPGVIVHPGSVSALQLL